MNIWQKLKLGATLLFGGFEAATDYLLGILETYLGTDAMTDKVEKLRDTVNWFCDKLHAYRLYCPMKWVRDYDRVLECVAQIRSTLADGKVTADEVRKCAASFAQAYLEWQKED